MLKRMPKVYAVTLKLPDHSLNYGEGIILRRLNKA